MSNINTENLDLAAQWRDAVDAGNPAGGLFAAGEFAESDIVGEVNRNTLGGCGTVCTGSATRYCC